MATGDVIGFLNADDVYADNGVLERVSAIMEKQKLDALFGDAEFVNQARPNQPLRRSLPLRSVSSGSRRTCKPCCASIVISISVVSHGQGDLVSEALADLARFSGSLCFEVILTRNIPEQLPFTVDDFPYPVKEIENATPKGFGANHNAAFQLAAGKWFCVLNPDIRMSANPFPPLIEALERQQAAVIAPAVLSPGGQVEDSVRRFPTPLSLVGKVLGWGDGRYPFVVGDETFPADWVGGMFMLFRAEDYRRIGGFDEDFFLYYEDVDICTRLWKTGRRVLACPKAQVIHDARRTSRCNLRYMRWHASSLIRYQGKHWLRLPNSENT